MPVTFSGLVETEVMLMEISMNTKKRVTARMYKTALKIQERAKQYAPLDRGYLEHAIKIYPESEPAGTRDELGRFSKKDIAVFIDMDESIDERPGKTVGDYAYIMHEMLEPAGVMQLGPESAAKQSGSGLQVGGWFLTRAANDFAVEMMDEISEDLIELFSGRY